MPETRIGGGGRTLAAATTALIATVCVLAGLAGCSSTPAPLAAARATDQSPGTVPGPVVAAPGHAGASALVPELPRSVPVRITIPRLGVDAPLIAVARAADGTVATPPFSLPRTAGWFTGSATPGQMGTAVIVGHVDTTTGPAVFYPLTSTRPGDTVTVLRTDRATAVFTIDRIRVIARDDFDDNAVYADTGRPELRLITCGGTFNRATAEYSSNVVVYAHLTAARP